VRAAYVGAFEVTDHELPDTDVIAEGRDAWDAVIGTVTLGKFFLGFGSIGICEHAFEEAANHLRGRILYGKPVIEMTHIRSKMAQAYARLTAMKLYAYRALDYVHAARADDRRYVLFCAVQKAMVSTEGVKVVTLLADCAGAKAFEADTYLEMALRDVQLIPSLEGSAHINLGTAAQFIPRYFAEPGAGVSEPASLSAGEVAAEENTYLMQARTGSLHTIAFAPYLDAYRPLQSIPNVQRFARQARSFEKFVRASPELVASSSDTEMSQALGRCMAAVAYGQLVAESARRLAVPSQMISAIFQLLVTALSASALALASLPELGGTGRAAVRRMVSVPRCSRADWDFVAARVSET
jgi:acyl-CoA dehydrogenase